MIEIRNLLEYSAAAHRHELAATSTAAKIFQDLKTFRVHPQQCLVLTLLPVPFVLVSAFSHPHHD
jgi:hypothetical protein